MIEIQQRYNILKEYDKVIDLGSSPGGWSQVCKEIVSSNINNPLVLAIDMIEMNEVINKNFYY